MDKVQLSLIPLLDVDHAVASAPRRVVGMKVDILDWPYGTALEALQQGPTPVSQLAALEAVPDGAEIVNVFRQFGLEAPVKQVPVFDANYEIGVCAVCTLTAKDVRRITTALKQAKAAAPGAVRVETSLERMKTGQADPDCVPKVITSTPSRTGASTSAAEQKNFAGDPTAAWLTELPMLLSRYADLGIIPDVGLMGLDELHGVYQFLARLKDGPDIETSHHELN